MGDLIDCESCGGKGKVPFATYRDNAAPPRKTWEERKAEEAAAVAKEETRTILKRIFWGCIAFPCVVSGISTWVHGCAQQARVDAFNDNKSGILLVEYDGQDKAVHCYVEREGTYYTGNAQKVAKLNNRHDEQDVQDIAKILNWDEVTQGKCYRFKYDFDTK